MQMELFPTCDLSPATKIRMAGSGFTLLFGAEVFLLLCFGCGSSRFPRVSNSRDHASFKDDVRFCTAIEEVGFPYSFSVSS